MNEKLMSTAIGIGISLIIYAFYKWRLKSLRPKHKEKHIFVSYSHNKGFGCSDITVDGGIKAFDDILVRTKALEQLPDIDNVVILNWKEYDK